MANMSFEDIARDHERVKDAFLNECVFQHGNGYKIPPYANWQPDKKGKDGEEIRLTRWGETAGQKGAAAHIFYDMPPHGFIYDFHDGAIVAEWKISESSLKYMKGDGATIQYTPQQMKERDEARAREREAAQAAAAEAAEKKFQADRAAALAAYEGALFIAPHGASGPGIEYLKQKGVEAAPGVRVSWNKAGIFPPGALVVPFVDVLSGEFVTLQRIVPGVKGYASGFGGRAAAFWIVPPIEHRWTEETFPPAPAPKSAPLVMLCEGYATGATCARLFGLPVGITGDAGKLYNVARAILETPSWKRTRLLIAADDDYLKTLEGKKNTGRDAAISCFNLDRARVYPAPPPWDWKGRDMEDARANPKQARSDWNDFAALYPGEAPSAAEAVKAAAVEYFQSR